MLRRSSISENNLTCCSQFTVVNSLGDIIPCIKACNWNANLYGYYEFSEVPAKRSIEFEYTKLPNTYGIRVFNFDNLLKIQIRMNESNTVSIKTFDLIGNQVDNQIFKCHNGENELRVQTNLPTGVYIYTIEVNQKLIKSDKFLVQ